MGIKLKGSTTATGAKIKRSNEFKATVLVNKNNGMKGSEALLAACEEFGQEPVDSFTKHAPTFTSGYEKTIGKIVEDASHKDHASVVAILTDAGMIEDDGEGDSDDEPGEFAMTNDSDVPDYDEAIDNDPEGIEGS